MPTVPMGMIDPSAEANPQNALGDQNQGGQPGPSHILQAAAIMHGMGRLLDSGQGQHTQTVGFRGPRRAKGFSQRHK